jgi:hypothetical protein
LFARSPRLRWGFARIFLYILAQNQTAFENQKSVFCPAGGQKEKEKLSPQYSIVEWLCVGCGGCTCAWGCCL